MVWVYGHYKYFYSYSAGIDFRRQILSTKLDPRAVRVKGINSAGGGLIQCLATQSEFKRYVFYDINIYYHLNRVGNFNHIIIKC